MEQRGVVIVITGNGKGKTTSAFGQALRAIGHGHRVSLFQFMKGRKDGEVLAAEKYLPGITIYQCGTDGFVKRDNPAPVDIEMARDGWKLAKTAVFSGDYDMVILDEINVALDFKLLDMDDVIDTIRIRPVNLDIILTGRYAPQAVMDLADTVSEVGEIRHHYHAGIKDRAGIEY